ncbi:hypothetical protein LHGZ1_1680 [Laribacter hongkongensis]|uniref:Uncharacterized protein n=1 Tax=Laribacter hongkongensis TaxID=168471 RepID=A0A248LJ49_9NEIS|nr:hypothetical protein LHGZ1_1680 [Laribacter hongkongensis]
MSNDGITLLLIPSPRREKIRHPGILADVEKLPGTILLRAGCINCRQLPNMHAYS